MLRRSLNLARRSGKLGVVPLLPSKLTENNVRKGFFERDDFLRHREALPLELKPVTTFAFWTGCRKSEILLLRWSQVDFDEAVVRLEPGETKNDEARIIPLAGELLEMLRMQKHIRDARWPACPWVFFRGGRQIKSIRGAWERACVEVGLVDENGDAMRLFHDLRRTGVRNLVRAGVPERVAMAISSRYRGPNANFVLVGADSRGDFEADGRQQCVQVVADALVETIECAASVVR